MAGSFLSLATMASGSWKAYVCYVLFITLRGAAWALLELNASSVQVGYLFEHPRLEENRASEAVITNGQLGSVLRLLCSIDPPLPTGDDYWDDRDNIVQWRKVAPVPGSIDSVCYWAYDRTKMAVSFSNITFDTLGTYLCSYGGLSQTIDVLAADVKIAEGLRRPTTFQDMGTLVMFTKDKTGLDHWTQNTKLLQAVGASETCSGQTETHKKPQSVHYLHPSDIAVVAAIGDGFTTGLGARATALNGLFTEYREVSWSIGGDENLTSTLTLPNILKKFNPYLKGFSQRTVPEGTEIQQSWQINLNVAFSGATTRSIGDQAKELVMRLKQSKEVDLQNDWKLLTIWIGTNDLCNACKDQERISPAFFIKSVMHTLNYLHKEVPRLFVNLVPPLDVSLIDDLYKERESCKISGVYACDCVATGDKEAKKTVSNSAKEYVHLLNELVDSGVYDKDDQFTVVIQPALQRPPLAQSGHKRDMFAPDCYHFSTMGQAAAAAALWNNMMEPVSSKATHWGNTQELDCQSKGHPYIGTKRNSKIVTMSFDSSAEDDESGFPSSAAIALAVSLTSVVILAFVVVWRSRRSRPRPEARKLLYAPYRPSI